MCKIYCLKRFVAIAAICFFLLLIAEGLAFWVLLSTRESKPFLLDIDFKYAPPISAKTRIFDRVDPLLGWSMSQAALNQGGFMVNHGCIVLQDTTPATSPWVILISGGSTSDPSVINHNWPVHLHRLLSQHHISHKIFIQAVGGYGSGQELLKLIRDGRGCKPAVHISYSGANETEEPGYVSHYEYDIFRLGYGTGSRFLPNTVALVNRWLKQAENAPELLPLQNNNAANFWYNNMQLMDAIAHANHCRFIGILQPVNATVAAKHVEPLSQQYERIVNDYNQFYPQAKQHLQADTTLELYDFTGIFDTTATTVYTDDCHLTPAAQTVVANRVFKILMEPVQPPVK